MVCLLLTYCPDLPLPIILEALPLLKSPVFCKEKLQLDACFCQAFLNTHRVLPWNRLCLEVNFDHPGKCPNFPWLSLTYSSLCTWLSLNTVTVLDWNTTSCVGLWHEFAYANVEQVWGSDALAAGDVQRDAPYQAWILCPVICGSALLRL
jgi:hypothetical protein